jgi:3-oxoacyl-[acyl-carrier-protein] synthase II
MNKISIAAASVVTEADLPSARLGQRFGRLDLQSQLALLAVASLKINFAALPLDRIGICLGASAGSLATDLNFWNGRNNVGGPSPTLFAYTLPSAAVGEIAIHFGLTGPNLCFVGDDKNLLPEAADLIRSGKTGGCLCVFCEVVSEEISKIISTPPAATACAMFLRSSEGTQNLHELREFDRDMKSLCALISQTKSAV